MSSLKQVILPAALAWGVLAFHATAGVLDTHDPNRTATIFVHGFSPDGASHEGVFGLDDTDPLLVVLADMVGLPAADGSGDVDGLNIVSATRYYGDTPPPYYTAQDIAELDAVTAAWGGGYPRYGLILAKYARNLMDRSGAEQVNFISASGGTLVVRWLIEKDSDGLASDGLVARWLSLEGVLSGSWPASNDELIDLWNIFEIPTIDVEQMKYEWIEANVHSPRQEAAGSLYGDVLVGMECSTRDTANDGALTTSMLLFGEFQSNDGVQGVEDMYFHSMTPEARFLGRVPTTTWHYVNHYELAEHSPGMAQVASFIVGSRRVRVTITNAVLSDLQEPDDWFWDWTPAEIVFDSSVVSPHVETLWGITGSICTRGFAGADSPIHHFYETGTPQGLDHIVFDDFIAPGEVELSLSISAREIDEDLRYGVFEPLGDGDTQSLGSGSITIDVTMPGTTTHTINAADFAATLQVEVIDYPFEELDEGGHIPGDVNGDGLVNVNDLLVVIKQWGSCPGCPGDLDGNDIVDVNDLLLVIGSWTGG